MQWIYRFGKQQSLSPSASWLGGSSSVANALLILLVLILGWAPTASAQQWVGSCPTGQAAQLTIGGMSKGGVYSGSFTATAGCQTGARFPTFGAASSACLKPGSPGFSNGAEGAYTSWVFDSYGGSPQFNNPNTGPSYRYCASSPTAGKRCDLGYVDVQSAYNCAPCPQGQTQQGNVCVVDNACSDTSTVVATGPLAAAGSASPTCVNGCSVAAVPGGDTSSISISFETLNPGVTAATGVGGSGTQWKRTGAMCSPSGSSTSQSVATSGPNYASVGGTAGAQCGTFNGEYFCVGPPGSLGGGCVTTAGGQAFCTSSAAAPPAPKNPVTGVKASPDTTIGTAGGVAGSQTVNHYNSTTVINGATTGGTSGGSTGGTGGTTTGTTSGSTGGTTGGETSGGTGSISGGADCDVAPTCDGDPIGCFISQKSWETSCANRIPTVADADAAINAGLGVADNDAPLVPQAGIFNVAGFFNPAAAVTECPEDLTIPLGTFGTVTVPVSEWCNFLHIIGLLVLASAALQSSRILLEAVS